jgi:O-antigen/teichoic acid export membrane protein
VLKFKDIIGKLTWSSIASVVYIIVQSLVFLYLSHHLPATVFGIFSLAVSFILFGINVIENGLPQSIIQTEKPKTEDYNAVLFLNFKTALFYAGILGLLLLGLNLFRREINFIYPTLVLLPSLFVAAYNKVQLVGLQKNLKFKAIAQVEILSSAAYLLSIGITIYYDLGIWILVVSFATKYLAVLLIINFFKYKFSDKLFSSDKVIRNKHWQFGKFIQGEKGTTSVLSYADVFIISVTLGTEILGFYDVLKRIILRPIILLYNGLEQLFYPLLVESRSDLKKYLENYALLNKLSRHFFVNITVGLYVCSPVIILILPASYESYLPTLKLLCIFAAVIVVMNPIDIILYSLGKSKLFFKWILVYTIPLLILIYFTSCIGLDTMLIGLISFYIFLYIISYFVLIRKTLIPFKSYFSTFGYTVIVYFLLILFSKF